jgi:poly-gamma-glutamate synthesis protein (capsule biosynthesis protein)
MLVNWLAHRNRAFLWVLSALLILAGAALIWWSWQAIYPISSTARQPSPDIDRLPEPTVTTTGPRQVAATPVPLLLAVTGPLPSDLQTAVDRWVEQQPGAQVITDTARADLVLTTEPVGSPLLERVYAPVARFATIADEVAAPDLLALWLGGPKGSQSPLVVDADTAAGLTLLWGEPGEVEVLPDVTAVANALWQDPGRRGIVPFDQLLPELKVLTINGNDPTDNRFNAPDYPLVLRLYLSGMPAAEKTAANLRTFLAQNVAPTNRDASKLTTLVMTGVTAMARVTALRMEQKGYSYPAEVIGPLLSQADITHISNEIPFIPDCKVDAGLNNLVLCSKPEYLQALRDVGVDIVGLTGNHQNDFGAQANFDSMQFYKEQGLPIYGGGPNLAEAWKPLIVEHNGNRVAFVGANSFGPEFAWATVDQPGSAPYDYATMAAAITKAEEDLDADLVFSELQWEESYDTWPIQTQYDGFRQISDAGADVVTGVQSHVPQAIEFRNGKQILYGLGNLFFDQMWSQETREGLIPRHTIYDGRLLSTKLLTTILEDYAQPRWTTDAERRALLDRVFAASGW